MDYAAATTEHTVHLKGSQFQRLAGRIIALIPAYNEERFIGSLVLAVQPFVDHVVVVDDGSRDHTAEIAQRAGVTVIRQQVNQGKAAAINAGFSYIRQLNPSAVVMLDGDGQHCADDIPAVLDPILRGLADMVIGSRFLTVKSKIPAYRKIGQHGLTVVTNIASGLSVGDSQSGFRAFSAEALKHISFSQGGFSIESELQFLAREHKLRVVEVPIRVIYEEPAKRSPFGHGMQVINGILQLVGQTRPLLFFSVSGLLIFVGGLALGAHIIDIYRRSHELAIGYGLLTVLLCVVGMLLFFAGVILHSTRGMLIELRRGLYERLAAYRGEDWKSDQQAEEQEELAFELGK
jgi:glycosyltransferase involved in cell wall biosynthesis